MRKTNFEKIDLFADLLEPVARVISDREIRQIMAEGGSAARAVGAAMKNHKAEIVEIFARLDGVPEEEYQFDGLKVSFQLLSFLNNTDALMFVRELFTSPQKGEDASSGDAMENTEDGGN